MAATLNAVIDRIEAIVEALTPPSNARVGYERVDGRTLEVDRAFWFPIEGRTGETRFKEAAGRAVLLYDFTMVMRRNSTGLGDREAADEIMSEIVQITNEVNTGTGFPSGSRGEAINGFEIEATDSDDFEITFALEAECEETDGI